MHDDCQPGNLGYADQYASRAKSNIVPVTIGALARPAAAMPGRRWASELAPPRAGRCYSAWVGYGLWSGQGMPITSFRYLTFINRSVQCLLAADIGGT
jgi:hypothetical protein